ncbi:MAG: flap endonuclease-1 [Candidatus Aenigmatarchaeota archaeon]
MGVNLRDIVEDVKKEVELSELANKTIAIDAFNSLYQFLSIIRDKDTGEPLRDSKGRITSHISGLFYRTINLLENGIKPVYVFDGEPPKFKLKEIQERLRAKEEAFKKWQEALESGEEAITYAQAASILTKEMVEEAKELLKYMGLPVVQAKSEGEAQAAYLAAKGLVYASASQDYDSLLFGSSRLVRNLSISGKRKLPKKEIYVEIKPEIIELNELLQKLRISREQLIAIGIIVGCDYFEGVKGYGPKKALELVRELKTFDRIKRYLKLPDEIDEIFNFFLNPPVEENVEIKFGEIDKEKILKFMVDERNFSEERVLNALSKLEEASRKTKQTSLAAWFKKS